MTLHSDVPAHAVDVVMHFFPCATEAGDIHLPTTTDQTLVLRRVARPEGEPKRILEALHLDLPERLSPDRLL